MFTKRLDDAVKRGLFKRTVVVDPNERTPVVPIAVDMEDGAYTLYLPMNEVFHQPEQPIAKVEEWKP